MAGIPTLMTNFDNLPVQAILDYCTKVQNNASGPQIIALVDLAKQCFNFLAARVLGAAFL